MQVTLTGLKQPKKRIQSIKALRGATPRPLSLTEAKAISDGLLPYRVNDPITEQTPTPHTLDVRHLSDLKDYFTYTIGFTPYEEIPREDYEQRTERVASMVMEIQGADYQGADREQHILAAEGLLTAHGRLFTLLGDQRESIDPDSMAHLLRRAEIHIQLAGWRL